MLGFDTGPGNTLLDAWIRLHQQKHFDTEGHWASQGKVIPELFSKSKSKSATPIMVELGSDESSKISITT